MTTPTEALKAALNAIAHTIAEQKHSSGRAEPYLLTAIGAVRAALAQAEQSAETVIRGLHSITNEDDGVLTLRFDTEESAEQFMASHRGNAERAMSFEQAEQAQPGFTEPGDDGPSCEAYGGMLPPPKGAEHAQPSSAAERIERAIEKHTGSLELSDDDHENMVAFARLVLAEVAAPPAEQAQPVTDLREKVSSVSAFLESTVRTNSRDPDDLRQDCADAARTLRAALAAAPKEQA